MYNGEVNVAQNSLNDFLAAAEELAVKGEAGNLPKSSYIIYTVDVWNLD